MTITIEPAQTNDLPAIFSLLTTCGLPLNGLSDHIATTLVARHQHTIVGSAALELYDTAALLRSVTISPELRGQNLGTQLTQAALNLAKHHKVTAIYLLTETAGDFFPRLGFYPILRSEVAPAIHQSL